MRPSGRNTDQLRNIVLETDFSKYAEGSCLAKFGRACNLRPVSNSVPPFMRNSGRGWVTAGMLPRATNTRNDRKRTLSTGHAQEIQRLIGRSLRAVTDMEGFGERQSRIDCDVLQADGGTRTAAITGGFVASISRSNTCNASEPSRRFLTNEVAAISCGLWNGEAVLDLDYAEDSTAQADANFVLTGSGGIVEVQGTAEGDPFSREQFDALLTLATDGIARLVKAQNPHLVYNSPMARRFTDKQLIIASHNPGKVREIDDLLKPFGVIKSAIELTLDEPEETGTTFVANAILKAEAAAQASQLPALSDDSGLAVDALGGEPEFIPRVGADRRKTSTWPCARSRKSYRKAAIEVLSLFAP